MVLGKLSNLEKCLSHLISFPGSSKYLKSKNVPHNSKTKNQNTENRDLIFLG